MFREAESKPGQRSANVRSQSNLTERCLRDGFRGRHKAGRGPCYLHPAGCRGRLDQGHERPDRGRQRYGLQGEHGGHLHPRRFVETEATRRLLPRPGSRGVFVIVGEWVALWRRTDANAPPPSEKILAPGTVTVWWFSLLILPVSNCSRADLQDEWSRSIVGFWVCFFPGLTNIPLASWSACQLRSSV